MTTTEAELTAGARAPDLKLNTPEGAPIQLSMLWKEKPLVLVFLGALDGSLASENAILWRDADETVREAGGEIVAICGAPPDDAVSEITGKTVEKPVLTPEGDEAEAARMMENEAYATPTPGSDSGLKFTCVKCGHNECEVIDMSTTSGMMSRMGNLQNRRFSAVSCRRCFYTELYKTNSGALRNVFDLILGA